MKVNEENPLGSEKISRLLHDFALPSIIAMLVGALYNIVDQFFIGRSVGMYGNAATNVALPLTTVCTALGLLFGVGGASNFNLKLGAGKREEAAKYIGNAITLLVGSGVVLAVFVLVFLKPLMIAFGATDIVLKYALIFAGINCLGFPFLILGTGGSTLVRADGSPKYSMICMLTGAFINLILNPLFVFVMDWGIAGSASATVIGQVVSGLMVAGYLRKFKTLPLSKNDLLPNWERSRLISALGAASCFNQFAIMVVQITLNNTLTHYGADSIYGSEIPLACSGIITKVNMIYFSIIIGLSQGLQPIVSFNYGAKKYGRVIEAYRLTLLIGTVVSIIAFACFQLFPRQIIGFFGEGSEAYYQFVVSIIAFACFQLFPRQIIGFFGEGSEAYYQFAEEYFRIYLFFTFLDCIQPISSNFFTSIGKATKGIILSLTRQIIFLLPLIVILPLFYGINGVMYAGMTADFAAAVLAAYLGWREVQLMRSWMKADK